MSPPSPNPRFVGTRIRPAEAGAHPRTAIAYTGVKKRTAQRAIISPRPARQVSRTLRNFRTAVGMIGSVASLDSMSRKAANERTERRIGVGFISDDARLKRRRTTEIACLLAS